MGHDDPTLHEKLLDVAVAQGELIVKPDAMADNLCREAVVFVAVGISWRRHIGNLRDLRWDMMRSSLA